MITHHPARPQRGADALIAALEVAGTRRIFTLSGNHVMPVFDAAFGSRIGLLHTRHEASAVHMADAWARLTGEVGVALVTGGPGHANAVSALYTAYMAEAPVLLLSGHAPHHQLGLGAFQELRQAEMAAPVCKAAWTCASADTLGADIARAMSLARSGRPGPVQLNLPTDVLEGLTSRPVPAAAAFQAQAMPLHDSTARAWMQQLRRAQRPLILAGPALLTRAGRTLIHEFEQASGLPVVGMESPRGVADASLGAWAQVLAQADCVLLLGKRCDFTLKFGQAPFPHAAASTVLQVDAEPQEIERSRRALGPRLKGHAQADAHSALHALLQAAATLDGASTAQGRHPPAAPRAWLAEVHGALAHRPRAWDQAHTSVPERLHPVQMLRPLQALLNSHPEAVLVCDGGEIGQWAAACLSAPHRLINGMAGAIGCGLPYALAARCAVPPEAPVVAVMGDGSVGFHIAEYDTAVRYELPFVSLIGNDARWNAEHQIQLRDYGAERLLGCELRPTRYDMVAQGFGAHGELVTTAQALPAAVQRAQASGLPACVNVMIEGLPAPVIRR